MDKFYDGALGRITGFVYALGILGVLVAVMAGSPRDAGGFFVGAAISALSLESWNRFARGLNSSGNKPTIAFAVFLGARYLIVGAVVYAIVRVSGITLGAVFVGLLVSLAAVLLNFLYELTFLNHS